MSAETGATRTDRAGSFASSSTETGTLEEREKMARLDHLSAAGNDDDDISRLKSPDDLELGREAEAEAEDDSLLPKINEKEEPPKSSFRSAVIWMVVNTLATIGIVRTTSLGRVLLSVAVC